MHNIIKGQNDLAGKTYLKVFPYQNWIKVKLKRRQKLELNADGDQDAGGGVGPRHRRHLHQGLTEQSVERHLDTTNVSIINLRYVW